MDNANNYGNCDCNEIYSCCDCGGNGCGCRGCYSCNMCINCEIESLNIKIEDIELLIKNGYAKDKTFIELKNLKKIVKELQED